jgi:hypothetical protein
LDFSYTAHAFFPERLHSNNHRQGVLALLPRFAQNLMHTRCRILREIASRQICD